MPSATVAYDNYINRLKAKRSQNVYYDQTARNISRMVMPFREMMNQNSLIMRRDDMPYSTKISATNQMQNSFNQLQYDAYNEASAQDIARREQFDAQIDELKFKRDEVERQEQERKKAEKNATWQAIGTVGGAALGALSGNPLMITAGANLGGGIAGGISALSTGDYAMALDSVGSIVNGASSMMMTYQNQKTADKVSEWLKTNPSKEELMQGMIALQFGNFNKFFDGGNANIQIINDDSVETPTISPTITPTTTSKNTKPYVITYNPLNSIRYDNLDTPNYRNWRY